RRRSGVRPRPLAGPVRELGAVTAETPPPGADPLEGGGETTAPHRPPRTDRAVFGHRLETLAHQHQQLPAPNRPAPGTARDHGESRSEEQTSELQSRENL